MSKSTKLFGLYAPLLFFIVSCNPVTDQDQLTFTRVTSDSDSIQNMYVVYRLKSDTNRTMVKTYWDNGNVQAISFFYKGKKDGYWVQYFEDGKISFEGGFVGDQKAGTHKIYFTEGTLSIKEEYDKDNKVDTWYYYNPDGSLLRTEEYPKK